MVAGIKLFFFLTVPSDLIFTHAGDCHIVHV